VNEGPFIIGSEPQSVLVARVSLNPLRLVILQIGLGLARLGLIDAGRARRTADLAWPRIVTGLARMSKSAVDVAMVGVAVGPAAIAGVGFATPFWGLAFALGGGIAGGTIALVSQRYGADAHDALGQAVRSSTLFVLGVTIPLSVCFWLFGPELIGLVSSDPEAITLGGTYLQIVGLGIPFAGVNLIASRTLIGAGDAWTPMVIRASGAGLNVVLNALLIFGIGLGVAGAAIGTVVANVVIATLFVGGLTVGSVPGVGRFPVTVSVFAPYAHLDTLGDIAAIGTPVIGTKLAWTVGAFPMLAIVDLFGTTVVAAFIVAQRVRDLLQTPGWGFGLAASSLVGQQLGTGDEGLAERYGREIIRFGIAVYLLLAIVGFIFAEPIAIAFIGDAADPAIPVAVTLIYAACIGNVFAGIARVSAGPLEAAGDTRIPFYAQTVGMYVFAIPIAYVGAVTPLAIIGLWLAIIAQEFVPAVINYYRFHTDTWKQVSRQYRPAAAAGDD